MSTVPHSAGQSRIFIRCPAKCDRCPAFLENGIIVFRRRAVNTLADRVSRVVDSDWIIASVLRMISGAVFYIFGICDGGAPSEKTTGTKEKMQI